MSNEQIPDILCAMVLAGYEVRLAFNALALEKPYCCHTYKASESDASDLPGPWSHSGHGARLVNAIEESWRVINPVKYEPTAESRIREQKKARKDDYPKPYEGPLT